MCLTMRRSPGGETAPVAIGSGRWAALLLAPAEWILDLVTDVIPRGRRMLPHSTSLPRRLRLRNGGTSEGTE